MKLASLKNENGTTAENANAVHLSARAHKDASDSGEKRKVKAK